MNVSDLLTHPDLRPWSKVIMMDLLHRADAAGLVETNQSELARRLGTTRATVSASLVQLGELGLVHPTFGGGMAVKPISGFLSHPVAPDESSPTPEPPKAPGRNQTRPVIVEVDVAIPDPAEYAEFGFPTETPPSIPAPAPFDYGGEPPTAPREALDEWGDDLDEVWSD